MYAKVKSVVVDGKTRDVKCPFCGSDVFLRDGDEGADIANPLQVTCDDCGLRGPCEKTSELAIAFFSSIQIPDDVFLASNPKYEKIS